MARVGIDLINPCWQRLNMDLKEWETLLRITDSNILEKLLGTEEGLQLPRQWFHFKSRNKSSLIPKCRKIWQWGCGLEIKIMEMNKSNRMTGKVIQMNQLDTTMIYWSIRSAQHVSGYILPIIRSVRLRFFTAYGILLWWWAGRRWAAAWHT